MSEESQFPGIARGSGSLPEPSVMLDGVQFCVRDESQRSQRNAYGQSVKTGRVFIQTNLSYPQPRLDSHGHYVPSPVV